MKKELLVDDEDLSVEELTELQKEFQFDNINVSKYEKKTLQGIEDEIVKIVNLVFQDFNAISFTRDFLISGLLTSSWLIIKKSIVFFKNRNKIVNDVKLDFEIKIKKRKLPVSVVFAATDFEYLLNNIDSEIEKHHKELKKADGFVYIILKDKKFEFHFY